MARAESDRQRRPARTCGANHVIDQDRLVQVYGFHRIDEHAVLVFPGRIFGIVIGILYDLRHRPHGDQIPSTGVVPPQTFA